MYVGRESAAAIVAALLLVVGAERSTAAADDSFETVWAFGDSLTDTGNLFALTGNRIPPFPYFEGRSSNGPVWIEHFVSAGRLDADLSNFAFAGANTDSTGVLPGTGGRTLLETGVLGPLQVGAIHDAVFGANDLVVLWAGANDIVFGFNSPAVSTTNLATAVTKLNGLGAKNFLVFNLPDLGRTPDGVASGLAPFLSAASANHNGLLTARMSTLRARLGAEIVTVDIHTVFDQILGNPGRYGFTNTTDPCFDIDAGTICANPDEYLSWDGFHPTAAGHELIGEFAFATLNSPSRGVLIVDAVASVGATGARQQTDAVAMRLSDARLGISGFGLLGNGFSGGSTLEKRLAMTDEGHGSPVAADGYWLPLGATPLDMPATTPRLSLFVYRNTDEGSRLGRTDAASFGYSTETRSLGLDYALSDNVLVGMMYSRSDSAASIESSGSAEVVQDGFVLYAAYDADAFYSNLSAGVTSDSYDRITRATGSRLFPVAAGNTVGSTTYVDLAAGYNFAVGPVTAGPVMGLRWSHATVDGYAESGAGPLNVTFSDLSVEETAARIGLEGGGVIATPIGPIAAEFGATWSHRLTGDESTIRASLTDGYTRSLNGEEGHGDALRLDAGAAIGLTAGVTGSVEFGSTIGGDQANENTARAALSVRF